MILSFLRERNFSTRKHTPKESRAFAHSMEGDIYLLEVEREGVSQFVVDASTSSPMRFRSLAEAKCYANKHSIASVELAFNTPYDQMIGLASCS